VTIVLVGLLVTNLVTWRALDRERSRHLMAERSQTQSNLQMSPPFEVAPQRESLESNSLPARVPFAPVTTDSVAAEPIRYARSARLDTDRLAKKLADPAAQDALRAQMRGPALQLYGDLLSRWHLSGPAAEPVLDALADYQSRQLVDALAPGPRAGQQTPDANAADNDAVRGVLNGKRLEELRAYDSALPDRQAIAPLLSELELAQTPLSKDTTEQLITIMHDERAAVPRPTQSPDAQPGAYSQAMEQWQTDLDQRIYDRAEFILSSAALAKLETFQTAQRAATSVFATALTDTSPSATGTASANPSQN
jgi:hypothetical protein